MSYGKQQKDAFNWSEEHVLMDPFAPRKVPSYEYRMPDSSPSDHSDKEVTPQSSLYASQHSEQAAQRLDHMAQRFDQLAQRSELANNVSMYMMTTGAPLYYDPHAGIDRTDGGTAAVKRSTSCEPTKAKYDAKRVKLERTADFEDTPGKSEKSRERGASHNRSEPYKHQADVRPGAIPINRRIMDGMRREISNIRRAIRYAGSLPVVTHSLAKEVDWNAKVLKFLEVNLAHAEKTNRHLCKH